MIEVELDAFSGIPNPQWISKSCVLEETLARLDKLPVTECIVEPPGLGYRGFILRWGGNEYRVYGRTVSRNEEDSERVILHETDIETELSAEARSAGMGNLMDALGL